MANKMQDPLGMTACNAQEKNIPNSDNFRRVESIQDVELLKDICISLWRLLDNIDTAEDMCKDNDKCFRAIARENFAKRYKYLISDGYNLFLAGEVKYEEQNCGTSTPINDE